MDKNCIYKVVWSYDDGTEDSRIFPGTPEGLIEVKDLANSLEELNYKDIIVYTVYKEKKK